MLMIAEVTLYFGADCANRSIPSGESVKAAQSVTDMLKKHVLQLGKNIFQMCTLQFVLFTGLNIQIPHNTSHCSCHTTPITVQNSYAYTQWRKKNAFFSK